MLIGDKIRKAREDKGFSPKYLADLLDIGVRTYESIEHNKRRVGLEEAEILGKELGFTPNELLTSEPRLVFENCIQDACAVYNHGTITSAGSDQIVSTLQDHIAALQQTIRDKDRIIALLESRLPGD